MAQEIEYLTAATSASISSLQSAIREVSIDNRLMLEVYCANDQWCVGLKTDSKEVIITWTEFLDIFHDFSKFVAKESEALIKDSQNDTDE